MIDERHLNGTTGKSGSYTITNNGTTYFTGEGEPKMELNYEIMFKNAVAKLQTDAKAYNELLRKSAEQNQLWFDSEGNGMMLKGQGEQARQVSEELKRYADIIRNDLEKVAEYRELKGESKHDG